MQVCSWSEQLGPGLTGPVTQRQQSGEEGNSVQTDSCCTGSHPACRPADLDCSCRAQARKAQEAEEAAERARLAEAEARRVAAQVQAVQNRQLRGCRRLAAHLRQVAEGVAAQARFCTPVHWAQRLRCSGHIQGSL